jgi:hypothetical protein
MAEPDKMQLAVFLPGNRAAFAPGERLDVSVLWALERAPGAIEVRLFWVTRGKGTEDLEIVATMPIRADSSAGESAVAFTLPEAPWSFSGKLISLVWGVEAVVHAPERTAACEFVLAPGGAEIRLHETVVGPPPA